MSLHDSFANVRFAFLSVACASQFVSAVPIVSNVHMEQIEGTKNVSITYDLADNFNTQLWVSVEISTNGISLPIWNVEGHVNAWVSPGSNKQLVWNAEKDWNGRFTTNAVVVVKANAQPDFKYMIIDLFSGTFGDSFAVSYLAEKPNGDWPDEYKTSKLVMRRVEPGVFLMGSPSDEIGRSLNAEEDQVEVSITRPFYIGVFELTRQQLDLIVNSRQSLVSSNIVPRGKHPADAVSYDMICGVSHGATWPISSMVDANSILGVLRRKSGLDGLDLPSEAQWEYACRGGTMTALYNGFNLTNSVADTHVDEIAQYAGATITLDGGTAAVGSYIPNALGLYDMLGNVREWCRDWYGVRGQTAVSDPVGPNNGDRRVLKGGSWVEDASACRSASRFGSFPSSTSIDGTDKFNFGFRLVCNSNPISHRVVCGISADNGISEDEVTVSWEGLDSVERYAVFRSLTNDFDSAELLGFTADTTYVDSSSIPGNLHYYWVRAIVDGVAGPISLPVTGFAALKPPPSVTASDGEMQGVSITWEPVSGASEYEIVKNVTNDLESATVVGCTSELTLLDSDVESDVVYFYWVRAISQLSTSRYGDPDTGSCIEAVAPNTLSASAGTNTGSIFVSWGKVDCAQGYEIWRSTTTTVANATKIGATTSTQYSDTTAGHGRKYYYWVKTVTQFGCSGYSTSYAVGYRGLSAPTKQTLARGVYISWYAVDGATSYEIWYYRYSSEYYHPDNCSSSQGVTITTTELYKSPIRCGAQRHFWVRACNSVTKSSWKYFGAAYSD